MRRFSLLSFSVVLSLFVLPSCCSKGGNCSTSSVSGIELYNFKKEIATDSINVIRFERSSNYTLALDTITYKGQTTANPNVFIVNTGELQLANDYIVSVVKEHRDYKMGNFSFTKKACGKCFMRANNEYKNVLSTYSVNGGVSDFDGSLKIFQ